MDAVAQANPNAYALLSNGHSKRFETKAWKFEPSSNLLPKIDQRVQLNPNGILCAKILTSENADEISLVGSQWVPQKHEQQQVSEMGLAYGRPHHLENGTKKKLDNWRSMIWFGFWMRLRKELTTRWLEC